MAIVSSVQNADRPLESELPTDDIGVRIAPAIVADATPLPFVVDGYGTLVVSGSQELEVALLLGCAERGDGEEAETEGLGEKSHSVLAKAADFSEAT